MKSRSFVDTLSPVFAYLKRCSCGKIVLEPHIDDEKNSVINRTALVESVRNGSYFMSSSPSLLCPRDIDGPLLRACLCIFSDDSVLVGRGGVFDLFLFAGRGPSSLGSWVGSYVGRDASEYGGVKGMRSEASACLKS